jgi:hypothetical protein
LDDPKLSGKPNIKFKIPKNVIKFGNLVPDIDVISLLGALEMADGVGGSGGAVLNILFTIPKPMSKSVRDLRIPLEPRNTRQPKRAGAIDRQRLGRRRTADDLMRYRAFYESRA